MTVLRSSRLTTCGVAAEGTRVELGFIDHAGTAVTVELPFDQAEAVVMTLPHLLARALKQHTGDDHARYVFDLDEWSIESATGRDCLIATLKTKDGFEVSFGIPFVACQSLGLNLQRGAETAAAAGKADGKAIPANRSKFN